MQWRRCQNKIQKVCKKDDRGGSGCAQDAVKDNRKVVISHFNGDERGGAQDEIGSAGGQHFYPICSVRGGKRKFEKGSKIDNRGGSGCAQDSVKNNKSGVRVHADGEERGGDKEYRGSAQDCGGSSQEVGGGA